MCSYSVTSLLQLCITICLVDVMDVYDSLLYELLCAVFGTFHWLLFIYNYNDNENTLRHCCSLLGCAVILGVILSFALNTLSVMSYYKYTSTIILTLYISPIIGQISAMLIIILAAIHIVTYLKISKTQHFI